MASLPAWIYGKVAVFRNWLYYRRYFKAHDLGAITISVGNITAGGTGKTPLVAYVAEVLAKRGERVCILTRGYGRKNSKTRVIVSDGQTVVTDPRIAGDEPVELAERLKDKAIIIADADRVSAAKWALERYGVTAFVLDDGFQHRKVMRDVDIVCIDATQPFTDDRMLPAGRLREPLEGLRRADAVVITRADQAGDIGTLRSLVPRFAVNADLFNARNRIKNITLIGSVGNVSAANVQPSLAFCGIGNPDNFFSLLNREHFTLIGMRSFADHHVYSQEDIRSLEDEARSKGVTSLITTAKDAVKLSSLKLSVRCYVVRIDVEINNADGFAELLKVSY